MAAAKRVVNVASVPKRSPFRYPGGKTWLVPIVRKWLRSVGSRPDLLVEPFAGGGIIGLTAVFEELVKRSLLVEMDPDVASVWDTIINQGKAEWLASEIERFKLSQRTVALTLGREPLSDKQRAFQTILKNRVQRGGILAPGAGLMKAGENGKGLSSRWYPATLAKRIREIDVVRNRLEFQCRDGLEVIERLQEENAVFFVDPPYTVAGARLYRFSDIDHPRLFDMLSRTKGDFLITYDDSREIRKLARQARLECDTVPMKNTHHARQNELLISKSLAWLHSRETSSVSSGLFEPQTLPA